MTTDTASATSPVAGPSANTPVARLAFQLYTAIGVVVFALLMVVGLVLRASQATALVLPPDLFYQYMTLHGIGMVGVSGLAGAAVMGYFLRQYASLSTGIFLAMLGLLPMLLGTLFYATTRSEWKETMLDRASFWVYGLAGVVFCLLFLAAGHGGVPRRFAVHDAAWISLAQVASIAGVLVVLTAAFLGARLLLRLPKSSLAP